MNEELNVNDALWDKTPVVVTIGDSFKNYTEISAMRYPWENGSMVVVRHTESSPAPSNSPVNKALSIPKLLLLFAVYVLANMAVFVALSYLFGIPPFHIEFNI